MWIISVNTPLSPLSTHPESSYDTHRNSHTNADFPQVLEPLLVHGHANLLTTDTRIDEVSCDSLLSVDETTPLMLPYSQAAQTNDTSLQRHDACIDPITSV